MGKTLNTLEEPHNRAHEAARHDGDGRGLNAIEADQPHHTVTHLETKAPSSEANEKVSSGAYLIRNTWLSLAEVTVTMRGGKPWRKSRNYWATGHGRAAFVPSSLAKIGL